MTTVLKDELQKVLPMMNQYIWKGPKDNNGIQEEIKLIDCDYDQLAKFYKHCMQMLYNNDAKNPGRKVLFDIVQKQIYKCRAELLIRYLRKEQEYTPQKCLEDLRNIRAKNKNVLTDEAIKTYPISNIMTGLPIEYNDIPVELVMDACLDILG